jgi:hypothetical protein
MRLGLGVFWLVLGTVCVLGRERIAAKQTARRPPQSPAVWKLLGWGWIVIGAIWLTSAFL